MNREFRSMPFTSILFTRDQPPLQKEPPAYFHDLALDRIVAALTRGRDEYNLAPLFHTRLHELDAIVFRQEVMRDLEEPAIRSAVNAFSRGMRTMRQILNPSEKRYYKFEKARWFLGAAQTYCEAVDALARALPDCPLRSRGMQALQAHLGEYVASAGFRTLQSDVRARLAELDAVRYCVRIKYDAVTVRRFEGELDERAAVEATFERFRRGAVKDYRSKLSEYSWMNHIEAQILDRVARLHPETFGALENFCALHAGFRDDALCGFERDVQFYIAWLEHTDRLHQAGLPFCYPRIGVRDKAVACRATFDLALADRLVAEKTPVVTNDFVLRGAERIFVVTGPNQGGKTTFARTFGQLHHLALLGCPVPGTEAKLFLFGRLFTHFEREETIANLRGKLHDDLVRIHEILRQADAQSIVVINEIFASTTLDDALYLAERVMRRLSALDALGVVVTFLDELAAFDAKTVSMASTVNPDILAERTFKVLRKPADGLAYALAIAEKHRVGYRQLRERIPA